MSRALILALLAAPTAAAPPPLRDPSIAVVAELNRVRADPAAYAGELSAFRALYQDKIVRDPGESVPRVTKEGAAAVDDAVAFLRRQPPLGRLSVDLRLARSAAEHVRDQGPDGLLGHIGRDGSNARTRAMRNGIQAAVFGEVIAFGPVDARAIVRELIVDDGVADRGHRVTLFQKAFSRAGAACGPHRTYRSMCVIDLASPPAPPAAASND